ncbi:putative acetyltransferase [Paenibacillus taihuensis]|uniref:Putative acetyltransferase n=1 Tax=Paenibacillus taihuensis TaxID=1156355 RepID=A0A3D9SBT7_9BACL|nr:GNAT family N-acetyltransferase [Paenibacillus taihuensis]REE91354.1 putative acetyltransferase [Paenibacillus taihuensis]
MAYLVKPSTELKEAYMTFYREWNLSGEDIVPWVVSLDPSDFDAYVRHLNEACLEEKVSEGWVPHSTYWLVDDEGKVVGAANIRHRLNQKLLESGGHIGYGVIPSERRKGYATRILEQALQETDALGIREVLVCCDDGNIGSERTIVRCGGQYESSFTEAHGNVVKRFWITRSGA